jgi:hypothetical protein
MDPPFGASTLPDTLMIVDIMYNTQGSCKWCWHDRWMRHLRYIGRLVWLGLQVAGTLWWLWTIGLGVVVAGVGGFLLSLTGVALGWTVVIGVGLFLVAAAFVLGARGQEELSAAHQVAEQMMKEDGLWPRWWHRLLHPFTPVGKLPVVQPKAGRAANQPPKFGSFGWAMEKDRAMQTPDELRPFISEVGLGMFGADMTVFAALERWMEQQGIPEWRRARLRGLTETYMRELEKDAG